MILNETCRTRFSLGQVLVTPRILEGLKDRGQTASGMRQPLLTFFPGSKSVSTLDTAGTGMRSNAAFIVAPVVLRLCPMPGLTAHGVNGKEAPPHDFAEG
jgi:hypothetical protein